MSVIIPFKRSMRFQNVEGLADYDFEYPRRRSAPGITAMVRAYNEETKIEHSLRSILPVVDEILVVDNASEDATLEAVEHVRETYDGDGKIRVLSYPHRISRYGPEHADTPGESVRNFAYYNNWSISHASFQYLLKWDADMVLVREVRDEFRRFIEDIQHGRWSAWTIKGQTIYRDLAGGFHLAKGEVNREVEIFPTSYCCRFKKHDNWEGITRSPWIRTSHFEPLCFYEVKFTDEDEFSHWSTTDFPGPRKAREFENYHLIQEGKSDPDRFERLSSTFLEDQLID